MVPTWTLVVEGEEVSRWILRDVLFICFKQKVWGKAFLGKTGAVHAKDACPQA